MHQQEGGVVVTDRAGLGGGPLFLLRNSVRVSVEKDLGLRENHAARSQRSRLVDAVDPRWGAGERPPPLWT